MNVNANDDGATIILVMGVSGCGKSTIGSLLANRLQCIYKDGDWFHPQANVDKMQNGTPLTDDDRRPWLGKIADWIDEMRRTGNLAVIGCSALKKAYRDLLTGDRKDVRIVYLRGDKDLIARRLAARDGHFMPPSLLDSQFAALEEPRADERPIVVSIEPRPQDIVDMILARLRIPSHAPMP